MESKLFFIKEIEPQIKQGANRLRKRRLAIYGCKCGNEKSYVIEQVESNRTKQCWHCARKSSAEKKVTHGKTKHPLYRKWQDMKKRCYNESLEKFKNYGGRGIVVCDEWKRNFEAFYNWCIENNWQAGLEIDRLDVNGNYSPDNCRITTHEENGFNKTNTRYVEWNGEKICLAKLVKQEFGNSKYYFSIYDSHIRKGKQLITLIETYKLKSK